MGVAEAAVGLGALSLYQGYEQGQQAQRQAKKSEKAQKQALALANEQYQKQMQQWYQAYAPIMNLTEEQLAGRNIAEVERGYTGAEQKLGQTFAQRGLTGSGAELEALAQLQRGKAETKSKVKSDTPFNLAQMKGSAVAAAPTNAGAQQQQMGLANLYGANANQLMASSSGAYRTGGSLLGAGLYYNAQATPTETWQDPNPPIYNEAGQQVARPGYYIPQSIPQ